jgi:hypothetical protein
MSGRHLNKRLRKKTVDGTNVYTKNEQLVNPTAHHKPNNA